MSANSDLEKKTGYVFRDTALLQTALTHASTHQKDNDNERLEFLGDRVLGLAIAGILYRDFSHEDEGSLAKRLTALVQQAALVTIAEEISLAGLVRVSGNAKKDAVLADAVEALVGAIFIDGGYDAAAGVIEKLWRGMIQSHAAPPEDPKSRLQEWAQARGLPLPEYRIVSRTGSDHAPVFEIEATVAGFESVTALASSKRLAEKEAAAKLLLKIESTQ